MRSLVVSFGAVLALAARVVVAIPAAQPVQGLHSRYVKPVVVVARANPPLNPVDVIPSGLPTSLQAITGLGYNLTLYDNSLQPLLKACTNQPTCLPPSFVKNLTDIYKPFSDNITAWLKSARTPSNPPANLTLVPQYYESYAAKLKDFIGQQRADLPAVQLLKTTLDKLDGYFSTFATTVKNVAQANAPKTSSTMTTSSSTTSSSITSSSTTTTSTTTSIATTTTSSSATPSATSVPTNPTDPKARNNVALYWGASPNARTAPLPDICRNTDNQFVLLSFLTGFGADYQTPVINIGNGMCTLPASGDSNCTALGQQISVCQSAGKKVLLSIGGASAATISLGSDQQANIAAAAVWNNFGGGSAPARPFGDVVLDGFDLDIESSRPQFFETFVTALRQNMVSYGPRRQFFITASPQCPRPDASIALSAMWLMDYIFVQFYNNPACNVGSSGFGESLRAWSNDLLFSTRQPPPQVYVGAAACPDCAGSGYVSPNDLKAAVAAAAPGISNFGGIALWDGSGALLNSANGTNYIGAAKAAVTSLL